MLHTFEPTDTQGHSMECTACGKAISIYSPEVWDMALEEKCEKRQAYLKENVK